MRNGLKIYDSDTHVQPSAETLDQYLDREVRERVPNLSGCLQPVTIGLAGEVREEPYKHAYRFARSTPPVDGAPRVLGEAAPRPGARRRFQKFMGWRFPTEGGAGDDAKIRLRDMDEEGVDVHMMVPPGANDHADPEVEMGFIKAQNRYLDDFCSADPHRLKSLIVTTARCVDESVAEIRRWGNEQWVAGIQPYYPPGYPLDHPAMEPIWTVAEEMNLTVCHHSFVAGEWPGYRDIWENPFLSRTASHPWSAMRAIASLFGSGIMDRHPAMRYAILESGFGWLPFWAKRMDDQAVYMGTVAEGLEHKPSEIMASGRFFASTVVHEGPEMIRVVSKLLGDGILMWSSDYPHAESRFPRSVDLFLEWTSLGEDLQTKLRWDNAVRCFGEP
jgi:predicted TIM-barrel fold metal-dependent hydrolase